MTERLNLKTSEINRYTTADSYISKPSSAPSAFVAALRELARDGDTASKKILADQKIAPSEYPLLQAKTIFDKNKITSTYAWIHNIAADPKYADHSIQINFYDDTQEILKEIHDFFSKYPDALPANVTLNLVHYKFYHVLDSFNKLQGSGLIDTHLSLNLKNMVMCSYFNTHAVTEDGFIRVMCQFDMGSKLLIDKDHFKYENLWRNVKKT